MKKTRSKKSRDTDTLRNLCDYKKNINFTYIEIFLRSHPDALRFEVPYLYRNIDERCLPCGGSGSVQATSHREPLFERDFGCSS